MTSPTSVATAAAPAVATPASPKKAVAAAFAGAFIEWYDFYLYGIAAALVFPRIFFPESDPTVALLMSFGSFAAGFLMRPLGAIVFGHFGDKLGRKKMLIMTVLIIGICTFVIGLLPGYEQLGVLSVVLLLLARLLQGFGIGGEFGGGSLVALENAPTGKRGLMGSFHQMGTPAGLLVSTGIFSLMQLLPEDDFFSWGWRVPFLLSGVFVLLAFVIRRSLPETPAFEADKDEVRSVPFFALIREGWKNLLLGIGARMADAVTYNIINVFAISFTTTYLGLPSTLILVGFTISAGVQMVLLPFFGSWSDRIGRRPIYLAGIAICGVGALFYFPILQLNQPLSTWLIIVALHAVGTGMMFSIQGAFFAEMFGTRMRYTGLGVVYQSSALIGGAPTPAIAVALTSVFLGSYWPAVIYLIAACVISAICVLLASENSKLDLSDTSAIVTNNSARKLARAAR
ncbi:MFS transporter [Microterricola viridarii]|uniref:Putative proline/betaine transporter n=2 Tax=Microterricola viridarii TaxID=412690 RepID=A0A1H1L8F5_9MICO|nr:MFS transporter [Microterricola viridarii]SDR70776.1 metabolite-proton symporter [Microterricola viridarii]